MARAIVDVPLPHVAALYRRVSSLKQSTEDKFSLDTQLADLKAWCAREGWEVLEAHIYTDVWTGEDLWQRPGLMRLLDDVDARRVGLVLAHDVDRLSRDKTGSHLAIIAERVERAGARLDCALEPLDATAQGALMRQMRAFAAGIENEKRVERTQRIRRNRATSGKLLASSRPLYGYSYDPTNVDALGRLLKERYIDNPLTAPIVRRIFHEARAGKSGRAIARDLNRDGIPTPTGRPGVQWTQGTINTILRCSTYWGEPTALRSRTVPVPAHLRALDAADMERARRNGVRKYTHKSREVPRPLDQQVKLPPTVAPALVSREEAEAVQARSAWNKAHAAALVEAAKARGQYDYLPLLRGGFAVCGGCGGTISVNHLRSTCIPGKIRHRYVCRRLSQAWVACTPRTIECGLLDRAVWRAVTALLQDREWIEQEVTRLAAEPDPETSALDGIDRQLAEVDSRIANKRAYAERVGDDRERAVVAAEVTELWKARDALSAQREAATAHYANWRAQRDGLEQTLDWCALVGQHMENADDYHRRLVLAALHVRVTVYRTDEPKRVGMTIDLPLSGVREVPLAETLATLAPTGTEGALTRLLTPRPAQPDKGITAPYKYPREVEFVSELPKTISGKIRRVELRERERARKGQQPGNGTT